MDRLSDAELPAGDVRAKHARKYNSRDGYRQWQDSRVGSRLSESLTSNWEADIETRAILRIQAELDRCRCDQRVWFLAPTVELCIQQHRELSSALPAYNHRLLTGSDNVDRWSEERIWSAALDQHRIVVSTYAVLADALRHGFVRMSSLALLVFDEAHHCVKKHPANAIMKNFYHPYKADHGSSSVPHVLGLSASLITKSNIHSMHIIGKNLDSISVTPRIHREDLLRYVHRPECQLLVFDGSDDKAQESVPSGIRELEALYDRLNLAPRVRQITLSETNGSVNRINSAASEEQQAIASTIQAFYSKAKRMYENLGSWAATRYVTYTLRALERSNDRIRNFFDGQGSNQKSLLAVLGRVCQQALSQDDFDPRDEQVSTKVKCLISFLLEKNGDSPVGIVFVEERATTSILAELLQRYAATKDKFQCVPFVGTSGVPNRKYGLTELVDLKAQKDTLQKFRAGERNLIIATNALEEGIDVQSCNVVACFDPPANVKSFIQRRGRARHIRSRLAILVSAAGDHEIVNRWQSLEDELSRICQNDRTQISLATAIENRVEELDYELIVPSTGAKLTADDTLPHLYHFCDKLPHRPYVDFNPHFSFKLDSSSLVEATVTLPNCLSAHLRQATSQRKWQTERAAKKDAAFQAYSALYEAGQLNDNLLPLCYDWDAELNNKLNDDAVGLIEISPQMDIWYDMAVEKEGAGLTWHESAVTVVAPDLLRENGDVDVMLSLTTPGRLHPVPILALNWDSERTFLVKFGPSIPVAEPDGRNLRLLRNATHLIYTSVRSERLAWFSSDFLTLFAPHLRCNSLEEWLQTNGQRRKATDIVGTSPISLVRVPHPNHPPYFFRKWLESEKGRVVQCEKLPRRRNFCAPAVPKPEPGRLKSSSLKKGAALEVFVADECTFDSLPFSMARIGLFMPDILQHIADCTILDRVQSSVLESVPFSTSGHLLTAICAPSARRPTNYQRFEFLGDSILKFVVSWHLFVSQSDWHEGLLTRRRSQLVCNANLARAAIRTGVTPYIITESISYQDWAIPMFSSAYHTREHRHVSYKTPADVVEALIGAAWLDSGLNAARNCISMFLPSIPSSPPHFYVLARPEKVPFATADQIESLIQYKFGNRLLLLEAFTHPSCGGHSHTDSYQRLEYLGDAVLDMLIAQYMATKLNTLSQGRMTQLKGALVNARLLGFLCLDMRYCETFSAVKTDTFGRTMLSSSTREVHLASFMRFASTELAAAQNASHERYMLHHDGIRGQLNKGDQYPWVELLQLRPDKFYSDIVESVLGAIFVDAGGDLVPCMAFIKTLGLQQYMERLIDEGVDVSHPRDRLQRWAGLRTVAYSVQRSETDRLFQCTLLLDTIKIAEVVSCCDREEAITRVAANVEQMLLSGETIW